MKKVINKVIKTYRTIEIEEIKNTNFAYYTDIIKTQNERKITHGITSKANLEFINELDPINDIVFAPNMYRNQAFAVIINKNDFQLVLNGQKHITEVIKDPKQLKNFNDSLLEDTMIVLFHENKIIDLSYNFISIPILFDDINGFINNQNYNLEKLLEKLQNDPYVINKENLKIHNIPSYNAEPDCDHYIKFKYLLPTDIYQKVATMKYNDMYEYILEEIINVDDCRVYKDLEFERG